jgi:hypothetical protein
VSLLTIMWAIEEEKSPDTGPLIALPPINGLLSRYKRTG